MTTVLRVENVSKTYRLGEIGYGALREDLAAWWARLRGKEDPNALIHDDTNQADSRNSGSIAALNNVSLELRQGEVLGIIGRNGAGKSTLLKLINGLTAPTRGRILIRGRVGSLLEVGTGFHPELTGRENVFLNGAILGMTKAEVRGKFDEIVAFSGLDRFIDTPVKRYSSGMYVRLGFSVAAHLEPEIMLIDEVLAVGDAHFQEKCRAKIRRLSRTGQSVVFVSHNMDSIREICPRAIVLNQGRIAWSGGAEQAVRVHLEIHSAGPVLWNAESFFGPLSSSLTFSAVEINGTSAKDTRVMSPESGVRITCYGRSFVPLTSYRTSVGIFRDGIRVLTLHDAKRPEPLPRGKFLSEATIPPNFLRPGRYSIGVGGRDDSDGRWLWGSDLVGFEIAERWTEHYPRDSPGLVNLQQEGRRVVLRDE